MDFIIITQPRAGTFFLRDIFNRSSDICWFERVLLPDYAKHFSKDRVEKNPAVLEFLITNYIKKLYNQKPSSKLLGNIFNLIAKYSWGNLDIDVYKLLKIFLKVNKSPKVILLSRKNILEQYISDTIKKLKFNELSDSEKKHYGSSKSILNFQHTDQTIQCEFKDFKNYADNLHNAYTNFLKFLQDNEIQVLEISYENLVNKTDATLNEISTFLKLRDPLKVASKFFKLEIRSVDKIIKNWNELKHQLKCSEYSYLLN
jgi:LPS sulfotransferase NodH